MTEEVEQHKVVFTVELLDISAEGVYLARRTCNQIFLFAVDSLESIHGITLNVFAASTWDKFFHGGSDIMLGSVLVGIKANTTNLIALSQEIFTNLKACTARRAFSSYQMVFAPCGVWMYLRFFEREVIVQVGTNLGTDATLRASLLIRNVWLIEAVLIQTYLYNLSTASRGTYATAITVVDFADVIHFLTIALIM